jgi:hypothetical protein
MIARRWSVMLWLVLVAVPRTVCAQTQQCRTAVPSNIDAGLLAHDVIALLQRSETFRSQCERIAAVPSVRVAIALQHGATAERAHTTMYRYQAGAIKAEVFLRFGEDLRELLAHEFEHIIEQIDGVNLRNEVAEGRAWMLTGGVFETRRAFSAGVQVVRECEALHVHTIAASAHETR